MLSNSCEKIEYSSGPFSPRVEGGFWGKLHELESQIRYMWELGVLGRHWQPPSEPAQELEIPI